MVIFGLQILLLFCNHEYNIKRKILALILATLINGITIITIFAQIYVKWLGFIAG